MVCCDSSLTKQHRFQRFCQPQSFCLLYLSHCIPVPALFSDTWTFPNLAPFSWRVMITLSQALPFHFLLLVILCGLGTKASEFQGDLDREYSGCWYLGETQFGVWGPWHQNLTIQHCVSFCTSHGFNKLALRNGVEVWKVFCQLKHFTGVLRGRFKIQWLIGVCCRGSDWFKYSVFVCSFCLLWVLENT